MRRFGTLKSPGVENSPMVMAPVENGTIFFNCDDGRQGSLRMFVFLRLQGSSEKKYVSHQLRGSAKKWNGK